MSDHLFEKLSPENEGSVAGGFLLGFGPGLVINLMSGCAGFSNSGTRFLLTLLLGITAGQLLFTLPFYFHFKRQGKADTSRGLIIGASVSCLVGVTCGISLMN